jgi:hypothetical protein
VYKRSEAMMTEQTWVGTPEDLAVLLEVAAVLVRDLGADRVRDIVVSLNDEGATVTVYYQ